MHEAPSAPSRVARSVPRAVPARRPRPLIRPPCFWGPLYRHPAMHRVHPRLGVLLLLSQTQVHSTEPSEQQASTPPFRQKNTTHETPSACSVPPPFRGGAGFFVPLFDCAQHQPNITTHGASGRHDLWRRRITWAEIPPLRSENPRRKPNPLPRPLPQRPLLAPPANSRCDLDFAAASPLVCV